MLDTSRLPLAVSVRQATELLPIAGTALRELISAGKVKSHFVGGKRWIPIAEIHRLANGEIQA